MSRLLLWAWAAMLLALWTAGASGAEVFVSPDGDDSAGGAKDAPLKTIAAALNKAGTGDVITLRAGTYPAIRLGKSRITLQCLAGENARLESPAKDGNPYAVIILTGGNVTLRNLEIVGGAMHAVDFQGRDCVIEDCRCHDTGADVLKCSPSSANIAIRRCELYNSGRNGGWWNNAEGIDNVRSDNMLVEDCYVHDIATNGAYAKGGARNSVFQRCLFARIGLSKDVQGQGVVLGESAGGTKDYENIDGVVRNCIFMDIAGAGVAAWGALRPKFINNTCINVAKSDRAGFIILAAGSTGVPSKDVTFVNNILHCSEQGKRALVWIYDKGLDGKLTMSNNVYFGGSGQFIVSGGKQRLQTRSIAFGDLHLNSLKQWQEATGTDADSVFADPKVDAAAHLTKDSPCIGKGLKVAGVTDDYDGDERTGNYDIGADQFNPATALKAPPPAGTVGTGRRESATQPAAETKERGP